MIFPSRFFLKRRAEFVAPDCRMFFKKFLDIPKSYVMSLEQFVVIDRRQDARASIREADVKVVRSSASRFKTPTRPVGQSFPSQIYWF
jgi:hypothetical protein